MTAASLFAPVLPPGTLPARAPRGEGAMDGAGLFALLLAGAPPVQADVAQGGPGPSPRPASALAPALARHLAPVAAPSVPATQRQALGIPGTIGPEAPETAFAAPAVPPGLPIAAQAGSVQASPIPQLAPASPETASPAAAHTPDLTWTAPAAHPTRADPSPGPAQGPGDTTAAVPPTLAIATRSATPPSGSRQTISAPVASPEAVSSAVARDAKVSLAPSPSPLRTSELIADALRAQARLPSLSPAGTRSTAGPGPEGVQSKPPMLVPMPGPGAPASDPLPAGARAWLEPSLEATEGIVARSERGAAEPASPPAPSRPAPPAPMLQLGLHIARAIPARVDRLLVQLEPASLGRVEVRLEFHRDNQVSAIIAAERPDTLDALQRDARALERSLHQAGLRLDSDGLTFSLKREQAHDEPRDERRLAPSAGDLGDRPVLPAHGHEPPLQWFRSLRALDISV